VKTFTDILIDAGVTDAGDCVIVAAAQLTSWSLVLFGTATPPPYLADYLSSRLPAVMRTERTTDVELLASVSRRPTSNNTAHDDMNATVADGRLPAHSSTVSVLASVNTGKCICVFTLCVMCHNEVFL